MCHSILGFPSTKIPGIDVEILFLAGEQLWRYRYIVDIGCLYLQMMHQPCVLIHANVSLVAQMPSLALLVWQVSRSRFFSRFLIEGGTAMKVESKMVPYLRINPRACRSSSTCATAAEDSEPPARREIVQWYRHPALGCSIPHRKTLKRRGCQSPRIWLPCPTDRIRFEAYESAAWLKRKRFVAGHSYKRDDEL